MGKKDDTDLNEHALTLIKTLSFKREKKRRRFYNSIRNMRGKMSQITRLGIVFFIKHLYMKHIIFMLNSCSHNVINILSQST